MPTTAGQMAPSALTWTAGLRPATEPGTLLVAAPPDGFREFGALRGLLIAIEPVVRRDAPPAADRLRRQVAALARVDADIAAAASTATAFAIERRLSRESHQSALVIAAAAQAIARAADASRELRDTPLVLDGFDRWDRPSLRALCLASRVASSPLPPIRCLLDGMPGPVPEPRSLEERVGAARAQFLEVVRRELRPSDAGPRGPWRHEPVPAMAPEAARLAIAHALAHQNYERVYVVAAGQLDAGGLDGDRAADLWRLVAIADLGVGWTELGWRTLAHAGRLAERPAARAGIEYLQGLVCTKRFYDQDRAERHHRRGLAILEEAGVEGEERALEECWLLNGLALVRSLLARTDAARRDDLLREAFDLEMRALRLVDDTPGAAASVLRHTLLANMAFLLQIGGRSMDAVGFWRRSFERYLAADSPAFHLGFEYRLGTLLFRAGYREDGVQHLRDAQLFARRVGDALSEERVAYALGWCLLEDGRPAEALDVLSRGLELAGRLRLAQSFDEHLGAALLAADRDCNEPRLSACFRLGAARPWSTWSERCRRLAAAERSGYASLDALPAQERPRPRPPSPRLPSSVPAIDLEGVPGTDLNRYLVADL